MRNTWITSYIFQIIYLIHFWQREGGAFFLVMRKFQQLRSDWYSSYFRGYWVRDLNCSLGNNFWQFNRIDPQESINKAGREDHPPWHNPRCGRGIIFRWRSFWHFNLILIQDFIICILPFKNRILSEIPMLRCRKY